MAEVAGFRLRGWPALFVGLGILAWTAWGFARHLQPVPAPARDAVQAWLVDDYTDPRAHRLAFVRQNAPARSNPVAIAALEAGADAVPPDTALVTLEGVDAHGWPDYQIVRAALTARHGADAPVHEVRYLGVTRTAGGAWKVTGESTAWNYWSVLVPAPRNGSSWP